MTIDGRQWREPNVLGVYFLKLEQMWAEEHQTDIKEQVGTRADCRIASHCLCLHLKLQRKRLQPMASKLFHSARA